MSATKRLRTSQLDRPTDSGESGILNEQILLLVFNSIKWDLKALCTAASVNRKLRAIAQRLLWRELCIYHAPRMLATLKNGAPNAALGDCWRSLAKLMFYCCGCESTPNFRVSQPSPGHFLKTSRFSKTSGRSFLVKKCRGDLLYVSDPCEHSMRDNDDDLGIYRGVIRGFMKSKTRAYLIRRQVELEKRLKCPYCGSRVWSMTSARLVPESAARRLGSHEGGLEYFVCLNGHLYGTCWLVPLSSNEEGGESAGDDGEGDEEEESGDDLYEDGDYDNRTVGDGSWSTISEEITEEGAQ